MKGKVWLSDSSKQHLNTPHKPEQHCRVHFTYEQICCAHPLRKLAVERAHPLKILYVNPWENLLWTTSTKVAGSLRKCTVYTPAKVAEYMYTLRKITVHSAHPCKSGRVYPPEKIYCAHPCKSGRVYVHPEKMCCCFIPRFPHLAYFAFERVCTAKLLL